MYFWVRVKQLALLRTVKWVTKRGHSRSFYSPVSISILSRARSSAEQAGKPRNAPLGGLVYSILLNFGSSVGYKQEAGAKEFPGQVLRLLAPILEKGPSWWTQEKRHQKTEVSQDSVTKSRRNTKVRRRPSTSTALGSVGHERREARDIRDG